MKKILTIIFALTLFVCLGVSALALEVNTELPYEAGTAENENTNMEKVETDTEGSDTEKEGYELLNRLYQAFVDNADKLFSLFSFVCSLVLAFVYKKGLVPILSAALKSVSGTVNEIDAATKNGIDATQSALARLESDVNATGEWAKSTAASIDSFTDMLEKIDKKAAENEKIRLATAMQLDMLKAIFLSSSLPEYQKEEIVKKSAAIEKILEEEVENEHKG